METFSKWPSETLDFSRDYTDRLSPGEEITSSTWEILSGDATLGEDLYAHTHNETHTTIWLEGGTAAGSPDGVILANRVLTNYSPERGYEDRIVIWIKS